ncbi:MAG: lipoate--protein ligase family protein [Aquificae bacterium]|nr:lipoate--protein ligase family protein [Aquificota bacterium]
MKVEICSPQENMKKDEEALLKLERGESLPSYRLYRWDRICLSLGHFQKEKNLSGLPVVRRPTGGGALLHGWDISFSVVDRKDRWGTKPSRIYRRASAIFEEVFSQLGVRVKMERFKGGYLDRFFCFWVPTLGELTCKGRKVVAMAMRTQRRAFLLHGSVYVDFDYEEASRLLRIPKEFLESRIISLREMDIKEEEFLNLLREKLSSALGLEERV